MIGKKSKNTGVCKFYDTTTCPPGCKAVVAIPCQGSYRRSLKGTAGKKCESSRNNYCKMYEPVVPGED
jgi:hypothetical protein